MRHSKCSNGVPCVLSYAECTSEISCTDKCSYSNEIIIYNIYNIYSTYLMFYITECPHGQYGKACETVCGQCIDLSECHHVLGTCLNGCKPGYKGNHCSQSTL